METPTIPNRVYKTGWHVVTIIVALVFTGHYGGPIITKLAEFGYMADLVFVLMVYVVFTGWIVHVGSMRQSTT